MVRVGIKRIYERIPLDEMGYAGGWAEVCVNPSRKELDRYVDATALISPKPLSSDELRELSGAELVERNRVTPEAEAEFAASRQAILGKVSIGGETWDLSTPDGYERFLQEGDAQVTVLMHNEFLVRRNDRLKRVVESFRSANGAGAHAGQERPALEPAT